MSSFRKVVLLTFAAILAVGFAKIADAATQSSTNFSNVNPATVPAAQINMASANYQLDASLETFVGVSQSAHYITQAGVPFQPPDATAATPSGGGSGGGGYIPLPPGAASTTDTSIPLPTLNLRHYTFKSVQVIFGDRPGPGYQIAVNGSTEGVRYPSATSWQRDLPLFLGINDVIVVTKISTGAISPAVRGEIERILIGDVNRSHVVDDADLSLFTRAWVKYSFFADFNEDSVIDDADLSLLASHWGKSF